MKRENFISTLHLGLFKLIDYINNIVESLYDIFIKVIGKDRPVQISILSIEVVLNNSFDLGIMRKLLAI